MQTGRRLRRLRGYAATLLRFASLVRKTKARGVAYIKRWMDHSPFNKGLFGGCIHTVLC